MKIRPEQAAIIIELNNQINVLTKSRDIALSVAVAGLASGPVLVEEVRADGTVTTQEKTEKES